MITKYWVIGGILSVMLATSPLLLAQDDGDMNTPSGAIDQGQADQMGSDMDRQQDPGDVNPDDQSAAGQNATADPGDMSDPGNMSADGLSGQSAQDNGEQLDSGSRNQNDESDQSDQSEQSDQGDSTTDSGD